MSEFFITPTNVDFLESILRDPLTGRWIIPVLTFDTRYTNPYYGEVDPLNENYMYQEKVIDHFYFRLKEKWLYKDPSFRKLLKYFVVEKNENKGSVSVVSNIDKVPSELPKINEEYRKFIFKYIEEHFISKAYISKILRQFVASTKIKWYDLFNNTDQLKKYFAKKIKKNIIKTIYDLEPEKK